MSRHARVEEVSSSELDSDSDPSEMDPSDFVPQSQQQQQARNLPVRPNPASTSASANPPKPNRTPSGGAGEQYGHDMDQPATYKNYRTLYPVYFDSNRTRAEGRRVGKGLASPNPLAREIADALQSLGLPLRIVLEPGKTHPKDWANPGRVKVGGLDEDGGSVGGKVKNKHHLYILVAQYLKAHPATSATPLKVRVPGLAQKELPPPAKPRGWKLSDILPTHSAAVTGGGVSDNMFKDMMAEMQQGGGGGALPPGMPPGMAALMGGGGSNGGGSGPGSGSEGGGAKKKKDKKKSKS